MRIGLYHGYELTGSGSNEYSRYLAKTLVDAGHEVHLICREYEPEEIPFITQAFKWESDGTVKPLFTRQMKTAECFLHQVPRGDIRPVYLTDKQRQGYTKSFLSLTDDELKKYHQINEIVLTKILVQYSLDILQTNHLIYQPMVALKPCKLTHTPLVIYPHGSAIEYIVKVDERYKRLALNALLECDGIITGNTEVRDRVLNLYPEHREALLSKTKIVGMGVDTSLFKPVNRSKRQNSIQQLIATKGGGGKSPKLTEELYSRLQTEGIEVTRDYWTSYVHLLPDSDLNDHLKQIPWEQNILLFVGALVVGKGLQTLITALPKILDENPQTHLVIVGDGSYREVLEALVFALWKSDKDLLLKLCAKGRDLDRNDLTGPWEDVQGYLKNEAHLSFLMEHGRQIKNRVHFIGRLDHSRLCYLFPCADLAVFPSVIPEATPLVLMESLSNGVFPLASYFSGFKDEVDKLEPFLGKELTEKIKIPMENSIRIERLASNINGLLKNSELKTMGPKLRQIAVDNYDWKLKAQEMVSAYRSFRSGSGSKARSHLSPVSPLKTKKR